MTNQHFQDLYQTAYQHYHELLKKSNLIATIRFIVCFLIFACLLMGYFQKRPFLYFFSLLCLIIFVLLVSFHQKIKQQTRYYQSLYQVYQSHIQRIQGQWDKEKEDGYEYFEKNCDIASDLDILGHHSLFQMINICFTRRGKETLAKTLCYGQSCGDIDRTQKAVMELSQSEDFIINMETYGKMLTKKDETIISNYLSQLHHIKISTFSSLIFIVSFMTIFAFFGVCFSLGLPITQLMLEIGFVFQMIFVILSIKFHNDLFEPLALLEKSFQNYLYIFKLIKEQEWQSQLLKDIQQKVVYQGQAIEGILELSHLASQVSLRQNIFAWILLNGFGMYDFYLRNRYMRWIQKYQSDIDEWFDGLSELELLMSLSVLKVDNFDVVMPTITQERTLDFLDLRHPLIHSDKVVGNDYHQQLSVSVITGSNMSGKTTFMRTIGLNLVLAYAGGFVFARQLTCSFMHILTSMRVRDNVEEGISTFYGELLRIKKMIEYSQKGKPMLCLIDEIFKGTNSLDRIAGAKATIQKLNQPHIMTFLTTHDFELCQMKGCICENYHFDEYYHEGKIYFDYRIKKGQSQSTNGQFLLKKLGIMEE